MAKHFLSLSDFTKGELTEMLSLAVQLKLDLSTGHRGAPADHDLTGRTLAMVFESPSTRTRVSFDVAMRQLGGETIVLSPSDMQLGRGETIADTARVLSRYVDAIMIRILDHSALHELARYSDVPVINGLTHYEHPCQVMADLLTYLEHRGDPAGRTFAYVGAFNNMTRSLCQAAHLFDFKLRIGCPVEMGPDISEIQPLLDQGADIKILHDAVATVQDVDCVITDTWSSMGDESAENLHQLMMPFQVNDTLMSHAKDDVLFMHCLPAHRGEEVCDDVIDGPKSVVFDEAENRLHAQKGILAWLMAQ